MTQDFLNNRRFLNEGDNLHLAATFRANERIDFVNLLDQGGPLPATLLTVVGGHSRWGFFGNGNPGTRSICFFCPQPTGFIGVPPVISDLVVIAVWDVLCD